VRLLLVGDKLEMAFQPPEVQGSERDADFSDKSRRPHDTFQSG